MNPMTCPRCRHIDQVRSVATVYAEGSGFGAGVVVPNQLALVLAPHTEPRRPRRGPAIGELAVFFLLGLPGLLIAVCGVSTGGAPSLASRAAVVAIGLGLVAVSVFVCWLWHRHRRRQWTGYRAYQRIWPQVARAWWEALVCLRCHIVFYAPGAFAGVAAARQLIPVPAFRSAMLAVAAQATGQLERAGSADSSAAAVTAGPTPGVRDVGYGEALAASDELAEPAYRPIPPDL